jgi:hypothetical protein
MYVVQYEYLQSVEVPLAWSRPQRLFPLFMAYAVQVVLFSRHSFIRRISTFCTRCLHGTKGNPAQEFQSRRAFLPGTTHMYGVQLIKILLEEKPKVIRLPSRLYIIQNVNHAP